MRRFSPVFWGMIAAFLLVFALGVWLFVKGVTLPPCASVFSRTI